MRGIQHVLQWTWVGSFLFAGGIAAQANGFRNPPESAAALGQGGGRTALIESPAALALNPANLRGVQEASVEASYTYISGKATFVGPTGLRRGSTRANSKHLGNLFFAGPIDEKAVLGFGITAPYGQSVKWQEAGPFRFAAPHTAQLEVVAFSPAAAYQATDRLRIGAAVNVYYADLELVQSFPWAAVTGAQTTPAGLARFEGEGVAAGGTIGIAYDLSDRQRVGLSYRSEATVRYEGDFRISNVPPLPSPLNLAIRPRSDFESEMTFPNIVAAGYGVALTDTLTLGVDVEWIEFSSYDEFPLDIAQNNLLLPQASVPQDWKDTWLFAAGLDWAINEQVNARAGYTFLESPVPTRTLAPTLPDADRHLLSVGIGYTQGRHELDLAYAYSIYDSLRVGDNLNPAFNGKYELDSQLIQVSYQFTF